MKTAEELGVSDKFYNGLVKLLLLLKADRLPGKMNMAFILRRLDCGTVGCITGWAALLGKMKIDNVGAIMESPHAIHTTRANDWAFVKLVTPAYWTKNPYTVEEITHALESFLYTGEPKWPDVRDRVDEVSDAELKAYPSYTSDGAR
jgi:hypothetical protein